MWATHFLLPRESLNSVQFTSSFKYAKRPVSFSSPFFLSRSSGVKLDESGVAIGWQSTPKNFLFHHGTLIRVYKAKLADQLRACGLYDQVPSAVWEKDFVVDIQAVGHGVPTLKYLAPYVHLSLIHI